MAKKEDFIKIRREYYDDVVVNLALKNKQAHRLLHLLIYHTGDYNELCISQKLLANVLQISPATVKRAAKYLYDNGYIDIVKSGTTKAYIVNPQIIGTSCNGQRGRCVFMDDFTNCKMVTKSSEL